VKCILGNAKKADKDTMTGIDGANVIVEDMKTHLEENKD
jgi:hypothetical protein